MDNERKSKLVEKEFKFFSNILTFFTILCLLVFFSSFGFRDSKTGGWYQQWFPNMNGSTITSMTFLDSLTGYAVTSINADTLCYILKTTNGGDNWSINYTYHPPYTNWTFIKIVFINNNIGFAFSDDVQIFKTSNGGNNWSILNSGIYPQDVAVLNKDTILLVKNNGFNGGVYRSTDGGLNWQSLGPTGGSGQPNKIYMYNKDMGFKCLDDDIMNPIYKTTNGGVNWFTVTGGPFHDIIFTDTLSGWKILDSIKRTTNGGLNWFAQQIPLQNLFWGGHAKLAKINLDSAWFVGGYKLINGFYYGIIHKTTNSGNNWGYQIPDTSYHIGGFYKINFVSKNIGWAYSSELIQSEIHTIIGGNDTTYYTNIKESITSIAPKNFELNQNYPNPFNGSTWIDYYLNEKGKVTLRIYDITGKELGTLVNEVQNIGGYGVPVAIELSSGVYFYKLVYINKKGEMQMNTKKMIVIK